MDERGEREGFDGLWLLCIRAEGKREREGGRKEGRKEELRWKDGRKEGGATLGRGKQPPSFGRGKTHSSMSSIKLDFCALSTSLLLSRKRDSGWRVEVGARLRDLYHLDYGASWFLSFLVRVHSPFSHGWDTWARRQAVAVYPQSVGS